MVHPSMVQTEIFVNVITKWVKSWSRFEDTLLVQTRDVKNKKGTVLKAVFVRVRIVLVDKLNYFADCLINRPKSHRSKICSTSEADFEEF
jgi:uncharacterized protein (DUF2141 family)